MTCKKCGKQLPEGHKRKLCEGCLGKQIERWKKFGTVITGVGSVFAVAVALASNDKINLKK